MIAVFMADRYPKLWHERRLKDPDTEESVCPILVNRADQVQDLTLLESVRPSCGQPAILQEQTFPRPLNNLLQPSTVG